MTKCLVRRLALDVTLLVHTWELGSAGRSFTSQNYGVIFSVAQSSRSPLDSLRRCSSFWPTWVIWTASFPSPTRVDLIEIVSFVGATV